MAIISRCTGLAVLVVLSALSHGEALFGRGRGGVGGGGGAAVAGGKVRQPGGVSKIDPEQMQAAASQASERVMMWGTSTIFQLKEAAQLKGQVKRLQQLSAVGEVGPDGKAAVKIDAPMYKEIMGGALGGVFLMLNSPNMGKVSAMAKSLMTDQRRQSRVIDLDQKVQESFAAGKGKAIVTKGPDGFLEGALLNKGVAEAHDRFMADVEALSSSGLAKKVAASAEAYHHAMLVYATNDEPQAGRKLAAGPKK